MSREIFNRSAQAEKEGWEQKIFEIIWEGREKPENIEFEKIDPIGSSLKSTPESQKFIDEHWRNLVDGGMKPWPNDTKPSRYRFAGLRYEKGKMRFQVDPCVSYHDFRGSWSQEFLERFGKESLPNPLGNTTVIFCKDKNGRENIMVGLREETADNKAGGYHISAGGFYEITKDSNLTEGALREVEEETGINNDNLDQIECRGVVFSDCQTSVVFEAHTNLTAEEIIERRKQLTQKRKLTAEESEQGLIFVPVNRIKIQQLMLGPLFAGISTGIAGLLIVGKDMARREGIDPEKWQKEMLNGLAWRSHEFENLSPAEQKAFEERDKRRLRERVEVMRKVDKDAKFFI